ncbi:MAG TPA: hypothetical protein VJ454_08245 [Steroidobacteraceae bacterium]|jgi:hypothetical protein|nr:hypothetical protein [Steroidobacteraceae bacterium]
MRNSLIVLAVGLLIAVGSWAPLMIVEASDPQAMPVGLGLFTFAVSFIGGVIALVGFVRVMIHGSRIVRARIEARDEQYRW